MNIHILQHMKALLVQLDDEVAAQLERVAPGKSRQRSEFIRNAIREALWNIEEKMTALAYREQPDSNEDSYLSADAWEKKPKSRIARKRR